MRDKFSYNKDKSSGSRKKYPVKERNDMIIDTNFSDNVIQ